MTATPSPDPYDVRVMVETQLLAQGWRNAAASGEVDEDVALGLAASDILAASPQAARDGRPLLAVWLVDRATELAHERRASLLASLVPVPDSLDGLDGDAA